MSELSLNRQNGVALITNIFIFYFLEDAGIVRTTVDAMTQGDLSGLDMKVKIVFLTEEEVGRF